MTKPTIVTRAGKGDTLSFTEVDANFTNLQNATLGITDGTNSGTLDLNDTLTFTAGTNISVAYNSTTKELTIGNSGQVGMNVISDSANASIFAIPFVNNSTGLQTDLRVDTQLTYTPSTNILTLSGITGYAAAVTLTADNTTNATNYPLFANAATGNLSPRTDTGFTYNPSTGVLTSTAFSGAFTGSIGASGASSGAFTTLTASSSVTLSPPSASVVLSPTGTGVVTISPATAGTINNMSIGATTASTGAFTTLSASSTVSGTGFSNYLASPPAIGGTVAAAGTFTNLTSTGYLKIEDLRETVFSLTYAATITPDITNGTVQKITLTGAVTFSAFANPVAGQSLTLIVTQDATGGRTLTSTMKFAGASKTLSTAANAVDIITVFYDGTTYWASLGKGFA